MKERKNIDRIFQEKFKDFEREPGDEIWANISSRLDKKDRKKPLVIPLWMKIGSVAAVLAVIMAGLIFTNSDSIINSEPEVVFEDPDQTTSDQELNETQIKEETEGEPYEEIVFNDKDEVNGKNNSGSNDISSEKKQTTKAEKPARRNSENIKSTLPQQNKNEASADKPQNPSKLIKEKRETQPGITNNDISGELAEADKPVIDSTRTKSILEEQNALANLEKDKNNTEEEEDEIAKADSRRLRLSTFAAPIFYRNIGSGNELSNQFSDNSSSSEVTLSYGVKVAYQISEKLRIRTGISKVEINNSIQDISYSPAARAAGFENISPAEDNLDIRDNSPSENGLPTGTMGLNSVSASVFTPGEISQQFGYIEIPLELEFSLIDKKFGLNIIGGGSSLFLDNNRVDLVSGGNRTNLGEASNINSTSFSTNIGLGMDYKLTDKFSISVEPIFKYQLNTFNNVDNVQPVNFGVYSGLNFRF